MKWNSRSGTQEKIRQATCSKPIPFHIFISIQLLYAWWKSLFLVSCQSVSSTSRCTGMQSGIPTQRNKVQILKRLQHRFPIGMSYPSQNNSPQTSDVCVASWDDVPANTSCWKIERFPGVLANPEEVQPAHFFLTPRSNMFQTSCLPSKQVASLKAINLSLIKVRAETFTRLVERNWVCFSGELQHGAGYLWRCGKFKHKESMRQIKSSRDWARWSSVRVDFKC